MKVRLFVAVTILVCSHALAFGQQPETVASRHVTLREAVELALKHNHIVRIARLNVEEKKHSKEAVRSLYFPQLRNDSLFAHVTDTQFIEIPAGGLGIAGGSLVPPQPAVLNQGGLSFATVGTGLVQPLTQLLKIKSANDAVRADVDAARAKAREAEDAIAVSARQLYYKILIAGLRHDAVKARMQANDDLEKERVQQVKYGSALEAELIESRAQALQAKQDLLSTDLQLSDLRMQFNDLVGLPLTAQVELDPDLPPVQDVCATEECLKLALEAHPGLQEARALVEKASAGVRMARREYIPDVGVFARHSYQNHVPFLARNFGTFGVHFSYDLFDGGKKQANLREREAQLAQARENLARVQDEVELRVQTASNKLRRTREMVAVSEELLSLRKESRRVSDEQLEHGALLRSQARSTLAQELEAKSLLLQSRLDYAQAADEMSQAIGRTPD